MVGKLSGNYKNSVDLWKCITKSQNVGSVVQIPIKPVASLLVPSSS